MERRKGTSDCCQRRRNVELAETCTANDGRGGVTGTTFAYTIANPVGNQAPVVASPLADQWLMGGSSFSFTLPANAFVDPEGQTLTYTKAVIAGPNAASWLNFNASTRTFSGTAPALLGGPWTVRVTATDPSGASVYDDFEIGVDTGEGSMAGGGESALSFEMGLSEETLTQGATQSSSAASPELSRLSHPGTVDPAAPDSTPPLSLIRFSLSYRYHSSLICAGIAPEPAS